jgi:hypothetical protein
MTILRALGRYERYFLHEFSTTGEYLKFNPSVYHFLQRYHQVILRLSNYEWAKFLAKNNPVPADLIADIETITWRNNLKGYFKILERYPDYHCFYCGKPLAAPRRTLIILFPGPTSIATTCGIWS